MMKKLILLITVLLSISSLALAVKPDNQGDKVDLEAALQAETDAQIAADADLQNQIDAEEAARIDEDYNSSIQIQDCSKICTFKPDKH